MFRLFYTSGLVSATFLGLMAQPAFAQMPDIQ